MRKKTLFTVLTILMGLVLVACGDKAKFKFATESITLRINETHELVFELEGLEVEFSLSEDGIISITDKTIKGLSVGKVTLTGKVKDSKVFDTVEVNVVNPITAISITGNTFGYANTTIKLEAQLEPSSAAGVNVTWTSANANIATVDDKGLVTLISEGIVTIKASFGNISDTHEIEVISLVSLTNAFNTIGNKNYQMDINISIYDEFEALLTMKFDDNVSYLKEGEFVEEWYVRDGRQLKTIIKDGDNYLVTEERNPVVRGFLLFENLQTEWFNYTTGREFAVKSANIADVRALFELSEEISIESINVILNANSQVESFNIVFNENRDPYYMNIIFSNYGNVVIEVPEVN